MFSCLTLLSVVSLHISSWLILSYHSLVCVWIWFLFSFTSKLPGIWLGVAWISWGWTPLLDVDKTWSARLAATQRETNNSVLTSCHGWPIVKDGNLWKCGANRSKKKILKKLAGLIFSIQHFCRFSKAVLNINTEKTEEKNLIYKTA